MENVSWGFALSGSEDDETRVDQSWRSELIDNISDTLQDESATPPPCTVAVGGRERAPTSQSANTLSHLSRQPYEPPPAEYSGVRTNSDVDEALLVQRFIMSCLSLRPRLHDKPAVQPV